MHLLFLSYKCGVLIRNSIIFLILQNFAVRKSDLKDLFGDGKVGYLEYATEMTVSFVVFFF